MGSTLKLVAHRLSLTLSVLCAYVFFGSPDPFTVGAALSVFAVTSLVALATYKE